MKHLFFLLILSVSICSCSSTQQNDDKKIDKDINVVTKEDFQKGIVIKSIHCKNTPSDSFAMYLPSNYNAEKKYPLIIALDPHAAGDLPVTLYKDLAEKYNYIIVGSNTSQNGKSWEEANRIVNGLMTDIKSRLSIDNTHIYLLGFSGGARIANAVTMTNGEINSVICCGAVSPAANTNTPRYNYTLISVIGTADFNYTEVKKYDITEGSKFKHLLLKFSGKHEWPPFATMSEVFWFLELSKMREKPAEKNDSLLTQTIAEETKLYNDLKTKDKTFKTYKK